jgi:hypothetical protein
VGTNKGVTVDQTGTNLTTVKILGDGSIELTNAAGKIVYDASGNKGGVTVAATATGNIPSQFIGSSGVDTLKLPGTAPYTYQPISDQNLKNVENIVITKTQNVTVNLGSQTEGFNITGNTGKNTIIGSQGADTINAGKGNDIIRGGAGADTITTGADKDIVIFDDFRTADKITDFAAASDDLYIDWAKAGANSLLNTKAFVSNVAKTKVQVKVVKSAASVPAKTLYTATMAFTKIPFSKVTNLATAGKISLGAKNVPLVSVSNFAKLTALLRSVVTMVNNANALIFARTQASGKLYFGAIIDKATAAKTLGLGGKITIKTIAIVNGNFNNADIFIM